MASAIEVAHALGRYSVHVEAGVLGRARALIRGLLGDRPLVIITDTSLAPRLKGWGLDALGGEPLAAPPGERAKSREEWAALTDALLARGIGRDGALVAIGGGSIGDLGGFVAATYLRGIPFVQVPTTLLAMLDASVGGKVGVDLPLGKNLVGAFHPPALVLTDPEVLTSLPERDLRGGMAEAVKHGLIADPVYFEWIGANAAPLIARDLEALTHLIRRSVEIKGEIVAADEREGGRRAVLNAGHTVAHALEQVSGYSLPHGEAVALGLVAEATLADRLRISRDLAPAVASILGRLGLPTRAPAGFDREAVIGAMAPDKKNRGGTIHFALPSAVGNIRRGEGGWTVPPPPPRSASPWMRSTRSTAFRTTQHTPSTAVHSEQAC